MKLTKISLIAAMLIGTSAFAIENTKVSGDVNLFYGTFDADGSANNMFDAANSYGDVSVNLGLTTDLTEGVSAGVKATYVTTLGLENNLVNQTWSNSHGVSASTGSSFASGNQLDDSMWISEAWIAGTAFDTTAKVGRQSLDTPLAFTETWGVDANTFEAAVLINQSIPDTTVVATYIGKSNGSADDEALQGTTLNTLNADGATQAGYVSQDGKFNTFGSNGVYAAGIVNNSFKPLTAQAWYYNLQQMATAYWLQADIECSLVKGMLIGAQYVNIDVNGAANEDKAYGFMLGYEAKDLVTVKAAYSSVDDKGSTLLGGVANVATTTNQSKLYTEMWWTYGAVSATGADSYSLTAEAKLAGADVLVGYYNADIKTASVDTTVTEIAVAASKSYGPVDTSVALILDNEDDNIANTDVDTTHLQVYLTYNF